MLPSMPGQEQQSGIREIQVVLPGHGNVGTTVCRITPTLFNAK